jgi:hypothetical protein
MNHQEKIHPPFVPDVEAIERRGHQLRKRSTAIRGAAGLGAALVGGLIIPGHSSTPRQSSFPRRNSPATHNEYWIPKTPPT